ncbi:acetyl-coenzyme A synthetase 2-like, mitochondrial [Strongylocentrotus purpuratus]|uniref:Acetyl-coenzyme A synthetase n=1 Tax=Strongylocentrotus purpuratus TaxID=7668 RepID=A0A7M7PR95_STRPU|nr:acetyl-coenzyme A synthetase 2-like, mitochondrial [Strongylocentrotus purpuratus]
MAALYRLSLKRLNQFGNAVNSFTNTANRSSNAFCFQRNGGSPSRLTTRGAEVRSFRCTAVGRAMQVSSTNIPELNDFEALGYSFNSHEELYKFSLNEPEIFWGTLARNRLRWYRKFDEVMDCNLQEGKIAWFQGGKINVSVNCIDRHKEASPDRVALIWEKDEPNQEERITYKQLYEMTNQLANSLRRQGVKRGDRVAIYMPVSPHTVAAMLACARIGAIHSVVFAGFSAEALASRIIDAGVETVMTTDQAVRGGKVIGLKATVDKAMEQCPKVKRVFVSKRTGADIPMYDRDIPMEEAMAQESTECEPEVLDSEDLLFMLYTSGSTGSPKGLAHSQAGYLLYASLTHKFVFDYQPGDVYACVADVGWITGHSYVVYGPLSNGATTVLFESIPTYPDPGRYWEMVERLKINQIYVAPTAVRLLLKSGDSYVTKYDRSTLRTLGCVGEPLNHEAWDWYNNVVGEGRCSLADTWWQTETGGICITPRPSAPNAEITGGPMRPFFGIEPALLDEKCREVTVNNEPGALCIRKPWPGIARTIYGNHKRYLETYLSPYPGFYFSGDGAVRDDKGYYHITGRMDDVINVTGHRLGTAEVEDAMDEHPAVAETAVVGYPHDIKGEGVYAYVTLKDDVTESEGDIIKELKALVRQKIAAYAVPDIIQITPGLPKTRSGKIMRRVLRKVSADQSDELGDVSTLADPSIVEIIVKNHDKVAKK